MRRLALPPQEGGARGWLAAPSERRFCRQMQRLALACLYDELMLYPKPGLVSPVDSGSHDDMTAATFLRSLFSLRRYFHCMTEAGQQGAPFADLRQLGMAAEARMLAATNGVNTHRGAIFTLGMLCAALGHCQAKRIALSPAAIRAALMECWGAGLNGHARVLEGNSHGVRASARYGVGGAREEAALGWPTVFDIGLPVLNRALACGRTDTLAQIETLLSLMAHTSDTTVYHRGGVEGAAMVRASAQAFLEAGGTGHSEWRAALLGLHRRFTAQRLSPGGAADLLAACLLVQRACQISFP